MCNTGAHMSLFIVVILMLNSCQETIPVSTIDSRFLLLKNTNVEVCPSYFWKLLYKLAKERERERETSLTITHIILYFLKQMLLLDDSFFLKKKNNLRQIDQNFKFVNILLNYTPPLLICMQIYFLPHTVRNLVATTPREGLQNL